MALKKILLFSAGEGSKEVLKIIIDDINKITPTWKVIGFIDKDSAKEGTTFCGYPVLGAKFDGNSDGIYGACGAMNNKIRQKIIEGEIENKGFILTSLIHPSVIKPGDFESAPGLVMLPGVKISYNVKLGKGVFINYNCLLGHDSMVGDYTFIGPSVTIPGKCTIGNSCLIGAGVTFIQGISIGDNAIVGAGTTVFSKMDALTSVTDLPRKITKQARI